MSFLKSSTSFTRFYVDILPEEKKSQVLNLLRQFAFIPIDDVVDEKRYGWTSFEDMLDTEFKNSGIERDNFICFSLRLDSRKISPAVFKKHYQQAYQEEQEKMYAKKGRMYVPRDRNKEIKEQVKLKLLAKTLPVPASFEVVWDWEYGYLYFGSTRSNIVKAFMDLFTRTFDLEITRILPESLAESLIAVYKHLSLDNIEGMNFVKGSKFNAENTNSLLGEDFLTWLWCKNETKGNLYFKDTPFSIAFEDKLTVRGQNGNTASVSGQYSPMLEARRGLAADKKVNSAFIVIAASALDDFCSVTVKAETFAFSSFKTPKTKREECDTDDEVTADLILKMYYFTQALRYFDEAYKQFLLMRLNDDLWQGEVQQIKDWIELDNDGIKLEIVENKE